jgi:Ca-activated chloride channel homolog
MTFGRPYFLLLLLLLPLLPWLKGRRGDPPAFVYSSVQLVRGILNITRTRSGRLLSGLRWLALACFIVALAQPRLTHSETRVTASGVDIVVALDMSGSMRAEDFEIRGKRVNRFHMARAVLDRFIDRRPNDRLGLVVFASEAFIATPLTLDHDFLRRNLERLELGAIDENRTAIGSALSISVNRLRELQSKSKIVILMTDGQSNAGKLSPLTAAEAAAALQVKVYTIGVGSRGEAPMPAGRNPFTGQMMYQSMPVDIDEETLEKIADLTGGKYYRADNTERLQSIYAEIDALEKTEREMKKYSRHQELFPWAMAPGLGLVLIEFLLRHTRLRRLP